MICLFFFLPNIHRAGPSELAHDYPENSKRAFWRVPTLQAPPKFQEKTPRESTKSVIFGEDESGNFGPTTFWDPHHLALNFYWVCPPVVPSGLFAAAFAAVFWVAVR